MIRRFSVAAALCVACLLGLSTLFAGDAKFNDVLNIGDKAPSFEGLVGVDGKKHSLSDYKDAKAIVLIFTCNHCPVAVAYEDRFINFTEKFKDKGVQVIAINPNTIPADRLDKMKERAEEKGFNFPYLYDESQEVARGFGASCTPHLFVLNQDREVAYMGAFDDSMNAGRVKEEYVKNAVEAVLAGKTPETVETKQRGCGIKYNKK